eukprot:CAMPEP_0174725380 /NCGR_PEP_ID=MMETSP1094-20130205/45419_1 /TAXON_ID=156173 /ORGANISM="Chrysochromulina brevifilum, Strain UTEX LB 985" /LENGTH=105 /DNA_ID=CAMNT_0015926767 /DNA_START=1 /DNA_END=318 /DNA_ORIENTATION=-
MDGWMDGWMNERNAPQMHLAGSAHSKRQLRNSNLYSHHGDSMASMSFLSIQFIPHTGHDNACCTLGTPQLILQAQKAQFLGCGGLDETTFVLGTCEHCVTESDHI